MKPLDIAGQRFGRLTAIALIRREAGKSYWSCQCDCGTTCEVVVTKLRSGHTKSCGCFQRDQTSKAKTTHGRRRRGQKDPTYEAWSQMVARCQCASSTRVERYIGRGITVCDRWRHSFDAFLADMGERPSADHSLERKNNDLGYGPDNCCWATRIMQANNKRNTQRHEFRGQMMTIREMVLATDSKLKPATIRARITVYGWTTERALSDAPGAYKCL